MRNIRLLLQYEGTRYQGWQKQENSKDTIQGKLEALLGKMCGEEIKLQGSGRTDAGVHARAQVANFHTTCKMTTVEIQDYMNRYLPEDIVVCEVQEAGERFHSRLNAKSKCYRYLVWNHPVPDVFLRRFAYEVQEPLIIEEMEKAAAHLLGEHDFKAFTSARKCKKSTVRRIDSIEIKKEGNLILFTFWGNGFLYHMVRIMAGTLLEVGRREREADSIPGLLAFKDRERAGFLAPAKGLVLWEVKY